MSPPVPRPFARALVVGGLTLALGLAGCSGDGGGDSDAEDQPTQEPSTSQVAAGMTEPGTELAFGEPASFGWQPRAGTDAEAKVVVERVDRGSLKDFEGFKIPDSVQGSTPYYAHVRVKNTGESDLGGVVLPLFLDTGRDVLVPPARITGFDACQHRTAPGRLRPGKKAQLCLVLLAPKGERLEAISLNPSEGVDAITWTGTVTQPRKGRGKKGQ